MGILRLQRLAGNKAVGQLLAGAPRANVQRLLADDSSNPQVYVPKPWADTKIDDRDETLRDVLTDGSKAPLKAELADNFKNVAGVKPSAFDEVAPVR